MITRRAECPSGKYDTNIDPCVQILMKRIVFLDYIRVFACFLVMLVHAAENFYGAPGSTDMAGPQSFLASEADRLWV